MKSTIVWLSLVATAAAQDASPRIRIQLESNEALMQSVGGETPRTRVPLGKLTVFKADAAGVVSCKWTVRRLADANGNLDIRNDVRGLMPLEGGKSCIFSNQQPGLYQITLAASGPGGVDVTTFDLEIVVEELEQAGDAPREVRRRPAMQPQPSPPADESEEQLPVLIARWASEVPAKNRDVKLAEAWILGGCFRATSSAIKTGTFQPNADPFIDVQRQAQIALGNEFQAWRNFFLKLAPHMTAETAAERATLYAGVGTVLAGLR